MTRPEIHEVTKLKGKREQRLSRWNYRNVGRCIYCPPDVVTPDEELTDEHIIAAGFGGELVLADATCERHREITGNGIERYCTQEAMDFLRTAALHRKGWRLPSFPVVALMPKFLEPTILKGPGTPLNTRLTLQSIESGNIERLREAYYSLHRKYPKMAECKIGYSPVLHTRLVAKIAHGLATWEYGTKFKPFLIEAIEGFDNDDLPRMWHYIGGSPTELTGEGLHVHKVEPFFLKDERLIKVTFRLYANVPFTPTYCVVAGRLGRRLRSTQKQDSFERAQPELLQPKAPASQGQGSETRREATRTPVPEWLGDRVA